MRARRTRKPRSPARAASTSGTAEPSTGLRDVAAVLALTVAILGVVVTAGMVYVSNLVG